MGRKLKKCAFSIREGYREKNCITDKDHITQKKSSPPLAWIDEIEYASTIILKFIKPEETSDG